MLGNLNRLVQRELFARELIDFYFVVLLASFLWGVGVAIVFVGPLSGAPHSIFELGDPIEIVSHLGSLFESLFWQALPQETLTRCFPLGMAYMALWAVSRYRPVTNTLRNSVLWSVIIFASVVSFAFGHANITFGHVVLLGMLGILWSVFYMVSGGSKGLILKPLFMTTLLHASYNFCNIFMGSFLLG